MGRRELTAKGGCGNSVRNPSAKVVRPQGLEPWTR